MTVPFDIFRLETGGGVLWLGSAESLQNAKARVQEFGARPAVDYLILNQETGAKLIVRLDDADGCTGLTRSQQNEDNS
jgi:hypothetical protein